jgi:hypothetical protein
VSLAPAEPAIVLPGTRQPDDQPTDRPYREDDARWHADEAQALALLAELTTKRSPWMAASEMDWST